jgi:gamma-glutamylcyclotransferase (GGCT)/AIG2-like uncharacterized protein YtfP
MENRGNSGESSKNGENGGIVRVFVYGTLKPGEVNDWVYRGYAVTAVPAIAQGQLYHLPFGYPALTVGSDRIQGVLLSFDNPHLLNVLDQFEQHDPVALRRLVPEGNLAAYGYRRQTLALWDLQGKAFGDAWFYAISPAAVQQMGGIRIRQGVWSSHEKYRDTTGADTDG